MMTIACLSIRVVRMSHLTCTLFGSYTLSCLASGELENCSVFCMDKLCDLNNLSHLNILI